MRVSATIVEPWELGNRPVEGRILTLMQDPDGHHRRATLQLSLPVKLLGRSCELFEVVPRSASGFLDQLATGPVDTNLTCIPTDQAGSRCSDDFSNQTGRVGMIATLQLLP
jgi:hypothetical protein